MNISFLDWVKVSFLRLLSSIVMVWFTTLSAAQAHEVFPSIGDMRTINGHVVFEIRGNIESFIAGINLTETADTDETAEAATYDELRALEPAELIAEFEEFWPQMAAGITLTADGVALAPTFDGVGVDPVGDVGVVRTSAIGFSAVLPEGAQTVQIGWAPEFGVLVLRQMDVPAPYDGYLEAGALSDQITLVGGDQASPWQSFVNYIPVGFDHIVPKGLDHILFVLGLFFLAARMRPLLLQVSLFTVAHTITLALAALGYTSFLDDFFIRVFGIEFIAVVEPLIALSIAYVAIENIFVKEVSPWRPFIIFLFGLLHGLGFASVLGEFGLPENAFVPALIGFNVGVEVGQLAVIAVMFLCVWQALRIDRGANEATQGFAVYGGLLLVGLVLTSLNMDQFLAVIAALSIDVFLESSALLFGLGIAIVAVLCMASIARRDQLDAYRVFVAVPCSVGIALVGLYWFFERSAPLFLRAFMV